MVVTPLYLLLKIGMLCWLLRAAVVLGLLWSRGCYDLRAAMVSQGCYGQGLLGLFASKC